MATTTITRSATKNRIYLVILIALFLLPMLLAWFLVGRWQPAGSVQHGELLDPVQPIPHLQAQSVTGNEIDTAFLKRHWTLVFINTSNGCGDNCRSRLYDIRQVRLALGKDMDRVQTLLLQTEAFDTELETWLQQEHPAMTKAVSDTITPDFFYDVFATAGNAGPWLYLIDPLGNLVMRYGFSVNSKGILEDLKRLLKYSKIG